MTFQTHFPVFLPKILIFLLIFVKIELSEPKNSSAGFFKGIELIESKLSEHFAHWLSPTKLSIKDAKNQQLLNLILKDSTGKFGDESVAKIRNKEELMWEQNPICIYKLVWKIRLLLQTFLSQQLFSQIGFLSRDLVLLLWKHGWPQTKSSIENVLMFQLIHGLDAQEVSNGQISNLKTNCALNSLNCYEIASHALATKQYTFAITWLDMAKQKALVDGQTSIVNIEMALKSAIANHNNDWHYSTGTIGDRFFSRLIRPNLPRDYLKARKMLTQQLKSNAGKREASYEKLNYIGLCSGRNYQSEKEKSILFCWREFTMDASLTIGPVKMELLARNPDILQIYDFIGEKETQNFMNGTKSPTVHLTTVRRIEAITILQFVNKKMAEPLQIQTYLPGSHFLPGKEQASSKISATKFPPLANFIVQLNRIGEKNGGETAFAYAGTVARPVRRSAVFWFNRRSDGSVDKNALHGLCPTTVGNKLVAKMKIPFNGKLISLKCGLRKNQRYEIAANHKYFQNPQLSSGKVRKRQTEPNPPIPPEFLKYSYVSPTGLTELVQLEWKIYPQIKSLYEKHLNQRRAGKVESNKDVLTCLKEFEDFTKNFVKNFNDLPLTDLEAAKQIALNPLAIYKVIRRFRDYYLPWTVDISEPGNKLKSKISSYLDKVYQVSDGPVSDDFDDAMLTLLKIQIIYDLNTTDMSAGYIDGVNAKATLNANDCVLIGKKGLVKRYFSAAIEWLENALYLVKKTGDNSIQIEDVYDELATAEILHDEEFAKKKYSDFHLFVKPISQTNFQRVSRRSAENKINEKDFSKQNYYDNKLWRVCTGKTTQSAAEKSKLFCWYETEIHMTYKIGPIKAELFTLSNVSQIIQFHDVLGDKAMEEIKKFTFDKPHKLGLYNGYYDPFESYVLRKVDVDFKHNVSIAAMKLMERLTGYKKPHRTRSMEVHYFAYGPGGARGRHKDNDYHGEHNLVTTFVFYLTDVEKGGDTAFPRLKFKVAPKKGSMLLWVNSNSDGSVDQSIEHASCPVVFGEKWIFAPDVFEEDQDHLQCPLERKIPYPVLVNGKPIL